MLSLVTANMFLPYSELILKSTISLTSNLISSIRYLSIIAKHDSELQVLLDDDLLDNILIIKTFISEKENVNNSPTIGLCIENLNQILKQLEYNINSITEKMNNHNQLWFHRFRSYNTTIEKQQIPVLNEKMKTRFELLIKISSSLK